MASNAFSGVGTTFAKADSDSSGVTYSTIAEINSIQGPNASKQVIDVTSLDSTGGYMEFIGSFRDGGEVALEMNFTRDGYLAMKADFEASDLRYYRIVLPDTGNTTFYFAGLVTAIGMGIPKDDKVMANVTIKVSGQITVES